jgi:hypothetical protein
MVITGILPLALSCNSDSLEYNDGYLPEGAGRKSYWLLFQYSTVRLVNRGQTSSFVFRLYMVFVVDFVLGLFGAAAATWTWYALRST